MRYSVLITDAVDEGLSKLGQSPKNAIYEALKTDYSMRRKDIPTRFAEFSSILLESIGPGARPVLEYIVDRFSYGIHAESVSCINLDESIKRVDMILKGKFPVSDGSDPTAPRVSEPSKGETGNYIRGSISLMPRQPSLPATDDLAVSLATPEQAPSGMSGGTRGRHSGKGKSRA